MKHSEAPLTDALAACAEKMRAANCSANCIAVFLRSVCQVRQAGAGIIPEAAITPVDSLPRLEDLPQRADDVFLKKLVVIKLNGGLGTKMGLDFAKSLIRVKETDAFLDFIARQILWLRDHYGSSGPAFLLMDSFRTQQDTLSHLARYPRLVTPGVPLDFLQSKVPKIDPQTLLPASYPSNPELEWCPPGHGDLYPSLSDSGLLDTLLDRGIEFAFISNSDNLAATVDLSLLSYFAQSGLDFLMEVAERTETDRKGGHLAQRNSDGRLILRETAQCAEADRSHFEGPRHRFFNTNNLWINLKALSRSLSSLSLPIVANFKPINPQVPTSARVLQLETAMGAAIECFDHAGAMVVPRGRFSPVKDTSDLLALRSDAYEVTEDFRLALVANRAGRPPVIRLDAKQYSQLEEFEARFAAGVPSLAECDELDVAGPWQFNQGVVCRGRVRFINQTPKARSVPSGHYCDETFE
jgi:UDP-N-acetylglucosamine pyrophosphorylase